MAKVLIRSEVNALVEGTFSTDLSKAVLYEELSGNTDFVVSAVNSVSSLNYTAKQALLDADVRTSASIAVTLTPRQSTIDATGTSVVFDITTAGTASVGTPVYSVVTATYDGGPATNAVINGTQLTLTFPANNDYTPKEITARVKLTIDGNESQSNLATVTQSRVEVSPSLSISYTGSSVNSASGNTNAFTITPSYVTVTGYTVSSPGSVKTSGATSVTVNYPANTGSSRTFTVTAKGRDVYGDPVSASTTFTQNADSYTFTVSPNPQTAAPTDTAATFTVSSSGLRSGSVGVGTYSSNVTEATYNSGTLTVKFPVNDGTSTREMTVTMTGTTTGGRDVSVTATINQTGGGSVSLSIAYNGGDFLSTGGTSNSFTVSATNVNVTGYSATNGATVSNTGTTGLTLTIPANTGYTGKNYKVSVSGTSVYDGSVVTAETGNIQQNAAGRLAFTNTTSSAHSTGTTSTQAFTNNNCTGVAVASSSTGTQATISGSNVNITFPMNTASTSVAREVCLTGMTPDNVTATTIHTITQAAALTTGLVFNYTGGNLSSASGSTNSFTITLTNATLDGVTVPTGCSYTTGGTASAPTLTFTYPANTGSTTKSYTITLTATDIYGKTITKNVTISQDTDSYTFSLSAPDVSATDTANTATITSSGISNIGWDQAHSTGITSCTVSGQQAAVTFPTNTGYTSITYGICLTGKTTSNQTVSATTTFQQESIIATDLSIEYVGVERKDAFSGITPVSDFVITLTGVTVTGFTVDNGASIYSSSTGNSPSVRIQYPENISGILKTYTVTANGYDIYGEEKSDYALFDQACSRSVVHFGYASPADAGDTESDLILNYAYLTNTSLTCNIVNETGFEQAYFDAGKTATTTAITVTSGSDLSSVTIPIYFDENTSKTNEKHYKVSASGGIGEAGESLSDQVTVSQDVLVPNGTLNVTPDGTVMSASTTSKTFTLNWEDMLPNSEISIESSDFSDLSISSVAVDNTGSGTTTVTGHNTRNFGAPRELYIEAEGTGANGTPASDTGYYKQEGPEKLVVTTNDSTYTALNNDSRYYYLESGSGSTTFMVSWKGVEVGQTITLKKSTNINSISPTSITVTSTTGSFEVTANYNAYILDATDPLRDVVLSATTTSWNGKSLSDHGTYLQVPSGGPKLEVTPVTTSPVQYSVTSVTFNVSWREIYSNIYITSNIGSVDITSVTPEHSPDNTNVVVTIDANQGVDARDIILTASSAFENKSDSASITQNGQPSLDGTIEVTPDGVSMTSGTSAVTFIVTWDNLKENSTITLTKGTGISSITPTSIGVGSNVTSSATITADVDANQSTASRNVTLTASGTDAGNTTRSDQGHYAQAGADPTATVSVGTLTYAVANSSVQSVDSVRFQSFVVGTDSAYITGSEKIFANVTASSTTSTWSSSSFTDDTGKTITGTLYLYVNPTGTSVDAVSLGITGGTINGTLKTSTPSLGYYVYEFNLGSVPASNLNLGNLTVSVSLSLSQSYIRICGNTDYVYSHDYTAISGQSFPVTWSGVIASTIAVHSQSMSVTNARINGTSTKTLVVSVDPNNTTAETRSTVNVTGTSSNDGSRKTATLSIVQSPAPTPVFTLVYNGASAPKYYETTAPFVLSYENVLSNTIGWVSSSSRNVSDVLFGTELTPGNLPLTAVISENTGQTAKTVRLVMSATTLNGQTVTASASTSQEAAVAGSISVVPDSSSVTFNTTALTFTVSWNNLKSGNNITITKDSGITSLSTTSITINDSNFLSGSTVITGATTVNGGNARTLSILASGVNARNTNVSDGGSYIQQAETAYITVTVANPTGGTVPNNGGTVTFDVQWYGLKPEIGISAYTAGTVTVISGPTPDSVTGTSGERLITVELSTNTGSTGNLTLTVTGTSIANNPVSGSAPVSQSGGYTPPAGGDEYQLGDVIYAVNRPMNKSIIPAIRFTSFQIDVDGLWLYAKEKNLTNVTAAGETDCATTWTSNTTFEAESGVPMTAHLILDSTYAHITASNVIAQKLGGAKRGTFNESMSRPQTGRYVYDYDLGTLPANTDLGGFKVFVATDPYYNIEITSSTQYVTIINNTTSAVTISVSLISSHYGFSPTGDTEENFVVSSRTANQGTTTHPGTRRQSGNNISPNRKEISVIWSFANAPASTPIQVIVGGNMVFTNSGDVVSLVDEYKKHLVLNDPGDFVIKIG